MFSIFLKALRAALPLARQTNTRKSQTIRKKILLPIENSHSEAESADLRKAVKLFLVENG